MSFFYSAHKELNRLYCALGATCWAQRPLALLLLWPFLTFLCLFDISLSHWNLCFSKMLHLLTDCNCPVGDWIWSKYGGKADGKKAHAEKGSVSEGGGVQRWTCYMESKLVTSGDSEGCEWGHYGFSLKLPPSCHVFGSAQRKAPSHFLPYNRFMSCKPIFEAYGFLNT